ncbi:Glycerol-3-phosphate cytidylyltransferase [uncultured Desulfobacterium sp.]|uniref:Glycerol-3-phosphate cytidylyltransferase n=1 Tax=uncultured Desulfobacterium sp. TaxID=201089 RepID=A0A445MS28_9BACT|nr:Glycerol-3-phosphate cytidylyltransferase [uncultured Desulfobacterium sp.]
MDSINGLLGKSEQLSFIKVITFGTFDVFHVGHLNILERAAAMGNLIVGVSSDDLSFQKKGRYPVYNQNDRMRIVAALSCVEGVFLEQSLELKGDYIRNYAADILVMGDDWKGKFDNFSNTCKVVYLPRTPSISTTKIIEIVKSI